MDEITEINQLKKIERDENGLIKGLNYIFDSSGRIDWKAMIGKEFLYVNPDPKKRDRIEKEYGKSYESIDPIEDKVKDSDLIILLNGLRNILYVRGFNYIKLTPTESKLDYCSVNCQISFIPCFETEMRNIIYEDNASAHANNTSNFAQNYLLEIASNRAFCRCIRAHLRLNIVSREELGASISEPVQEKQTILSSNTQIKLLQDLLDSKKVSFKHLQERMKMDGKFDESYTSIEKLPKDIIFEYIGRLKAKKE